MLNILCLHDRFYHTVPMTPLEVGQSVSPSKPFHRVNTIYAHVHIAKTIGTTINADLAHRYERVCGHKGYSYDAYGHAARLQALANRLDDNRTSSTLTVTSDTEDTISKSDRRYNRGRVPPSVMAEIGFEDCDFVSLESVWESWVRDMPLREWRERNVHLEFHIPCRDPLQLMMSQCNRAVPKFDCFAEDLVKEVEKCAIATRRFSRKLIPAIHKEMTPALSSFRCFDPYPPAKYTDYMGTKLQEKLIPSKSIHRASNAPRNRDTECLWKMDTEFQERVRKILVEKYFYYSFCSQCMGSDDELQLDATK